MQVDYSKSNYSLEKIPSGTYRVVVGKNPRQEILKYMHLLAALMRQEIDLIVTNDEDSSGHPLGVEQMNPESQKFQGGVLTILTSGSTGHPKQISRRISPDKNGRESRRRNWVLCYPLDRWSGISTILEVLTSNSSIFIPRDYSLKSINEAIAETENASISLTPALFKSIALSHHEKIEFRNVLQVTFGGEYANQNILDQAAKRYPMARITHIYASSELGDFLIDSSGKEGYSWPKARSQGATLSEQGELIVGEFHTGDLWELIDERIYFIGRATEIINVGGNKVSPAHLTKVALNIEGVEDAQFYGIPNPLLGAVVGLKYVGQVSPRELKATLRDLLPKFALPMRIEQVAEIELEKNMKRRVLNLE
jgi:acyl-CoA synthetase (AMP-forming)/AMP-acid ligase II